MSRTIITNSGSDFFTNINGEMFLGELCKKLKVKYFQRNLLFGPILAFSMTEEESIQTANKIEEYSNQITKIDQTFKYYFEDNITVNNFKDNLLDYAKDFRKSKGYLCEG